MLTLVRRAFSLLLLALAGVGRVEGDAHIVQKFDGTVVNTSTAAFTVGDKWELLWFSGGPPLNITVLTADQQVVAGTHGTFHGAIYIAKGGTYYIQINRDHPEMKAPWQMVVAEVANGTNLSTAGLSPMLVNPGDTGYTPPSQVLPPGSSAGAPGTSPFGIASSPQAVTPPTPSAPLTPPAAPLPLAKLSEEQARAVVLIKGDKAEGTGFMIKTPDGPAVITNIHVIADNPNLKITTNTGALVTVTSEKCAADRDLAMLSIQDDKAFAYMQMAPNISAVVQPGDDVVTPGNSQGGEVMLNTSGKVLGVGPERIEIDNPIYHGNSGGPVFHTKSGTVLGVVTEAEKVDLSNDLDKTSFASRNSAIAGQMRYFALRLDTVSAWEAIDPGVFHAETAFLNHFEQQSRRLDAYLNSSDGNNRNAASSSGGQDESKIYLDDEKIMRAENNYQSSAGGGDTAQHIEALRSLLFDLQGVADLNMDKMQNPSNFYSFDRDRVHEELSYRQALKDELESIGSHIERLSHLPRSN